MRSLWIHGWATDSRVFRPVLAGLPDPITASAATVNFPGYGAGSETDSSADYAAWLLLKIQKLAGGSRLVLVGWSLGAMLALEAAAALPKSVSGLVLISGCARFVADERNPHGRDPRVVRAMIHRLGRNCRSVVSTFLNGMFSPSEQQYSQAFIENPGNRYLDFSPSALDDGLNYLLTTDLVHCPAAVACPVLLLHGSEDTVVDCRLGAALDSQLPNSRLHVLEGAGHAPHWTRSGQCAELIGEFIESCGKR